MLCCQAFSISLKLGQRASPTKSLRFRASSIYGFCLHGLGSRALGLNQSVCVEIGVQNSGVTTRALSVGFRVKGLGFWCMGLGDQVLGLLGCSRVFRFTVGQFSCSSFCVARRKAKRAQKQNSWSSCAGSSRFVAALMVPLVSEQLPGSRMRLLRSATLTKIDLRWESVPDFHEWEVLPYERKSPVHYFLLRNDLLGGVCLNYHRAGGLVGVGRWNASSCRNSEETAAVFFEPFPMSPSDSVLFGVALDQLVLTCPELQKRLRQVNRPS